MEVIDSPSEVSLSTATLLLHRIYLPIGLVCSDRQIRIVHVRFMQSCDWASAVNDAFETPRVEVEHPLPQTDYHNHVLLPARCGVAGRYQDRHDQRYFAWTDRKEW